MQRISVIGSGTMGNGIVHTFTQYGFEVALIDISPAALTKALATIAGNLDRQIKKKIITETQKKDTLGRISTYTDVSKGVRLADLVVEAATENEQIKLSLFEQMDKQCPEHTILASNTSSISITKIAAATQRPELVIGMHFMNPVPMMKLVEVIKGYSTTANTANKVIALAKQLDKVPVAANDYPGFVANRILMPMINEAI